MHYRKNGINFALFMGVRKAMKHKNERRNCTLRSDKDEQNN